MIRRLAIAFGIFAALLLAALALIALLFNPNDYKDRIAAAVKAPRAKKASSWPQLRSKCCCVAK